MQSEGCYYEEQKSNGSDPHFNDLQANRTSRIIYNIALNLSVSWDTLQPNLLLSYTE